MTVVAQTIGFGLPPEPVEGFVTFFDPGLVILALTPAGKPAAGATVAMALPHKDLANIR